MRDKLTRREDRALHKALRELVLTQYPNPERKDCPGTPVIRAIATKTIDMFDPAHEHVTSCSPCFRELTEMQRRLQRRKVMFWAMGVTGTAVVILAFLFARSGFQGITRPFRQQAVQTDQTPGEPQAPTPRGEAVQQGPSAPGAQPLQPVYETALLDLRHASVSRSVEAAGSATEPIELPRGLLALTVQLPVGSDAGSYEAEIRDSNQQAILNTKGQAVIENGITKLLIHADTRSMQTGQHEFAWRLADFGWRRHPILIR